MPGPLTYFKRDPNRKGRGPGVYYHRGHGVYSKYSVPRDEKIIAKNPPQKRKRYLHTGDVWARVWQAQQLGEQTGNWRKALEIVMEELSKITETPKTKLRILPHPVKSALRGRFGGGYAIGYYVPKGYLRRGRIAEKEEIAVAKKLWVKRRGIIKYFGAPVEGWDPIETFFHEWGHHIHWTKKKPEPPMNMLYGKREEIAKSFGRLYIEKVKTKKLSI